MVSKSSLAEGPRFEPISRKFEFSFVYLKKRDIHIKPTSLLFKMDSHYKENEI